MASPRNNGNWNGGEAIMFLLLSKLVGRAGHLPPELITGW